MNYEIVHMQEKTTAGIRIRTSNFDPEMTKNIGALWEKFFEGGVFASIACKTGKGIYGIYTNYDSDVNGKYDVIVSCETNRCKELPDGVAEQKIPEGKYAKFAVKGDPKTAVSSAWGEIWKLDLDRKYSCDFEEYMENGEINIYIALK